MAPHLKDEIDQCFAYGHFVYKATQAEGGGAKSSVILYENIWALKIQIVVLKYKV